MAPCAKLKMPVALYVRTTPMPARAKTQPVAIPAIVSSSEITRLHLFLDQFRRRVAHGARLQPPGPDVSGRHLDDTVFVGDHAALGAVITLAVREGDEDGNAFGARPSVG